MRLLDKFISFIFSVIMLLVAIVLVLVGTSVIDPQMILDTLGEKVFNPEIISSGIFNPVTLVGVVLFLAALKITVFNSFFKNKSRGPIKVKTKNGEVEITQDTIINIAKNATMSFDNVKEVQARMVKKCKGIAVYESIQVYQNTNIKELIDAVQEEVKEKITSTTGVTVNKVSTSIKNIYNGKKKEAPENKAPEFVPVKPIPAETHEGVFNVDAAVEKMSDVKEVPEEVKEAGDIDTTKEE